MRFLWNVSGRQTDLYIYSDFAFDMQYKMMSLFGVFQQAALIRRDIVEPRDYYSNTVNHLEMLEIMTQQDLTNLNVWREAIRKSSLSWHEYSHKMYKGMQKVHELQPLVETPLTSVELAYLHKKIQYPGDPSSLAEISDDALRWIIQGYLLNINNNLLLSREYSTGLLDWFDNEPFYATKLALGKVGQASAISSVAQGGAILSFYLPIERITSIQELIKVRDKAKGLREYIEAKRWDDKGADEKTLLKILLDIERAQRKTMYHQKISSYFTLPLSLIPIAGPFIEKIVKEIVDWGIDNKFLEDYKWHFSLLDYSSIIDNQSSLIEQSQDILLSEDVFDESPEHCAAITKTGKKCKNKAKRGSKYCWIHEPQNKSSL